MSTIEDHQRPLRDVFGRKMNNTSDVSTTSRFTLANCDEIYQSYKLPCDSEEMDVSGRCTV